MSHYLVIRLSALGDVAMLCAVLREAANAFPDNRYTLLTRPKMQALLQDMPDNVSFLVYGEKMNWQAFDRVIDAHSVWRSWRMDLQAFCHLKPVRFLHKGRLQKWRFLHTHRRDTRPANVSITPMIDRYRQLFNLLPATNLPATSIGNSSEAHRKLIGSSSNSKAIVTRIGIAPFAAHKGKIYPLDKMEQVVKALSEQGFEIMLFGAGKQEQDILERWEKQYPHVHSLAGRQTLADDLQVMRSLGLMLTMDSGNMHLASLVGTRVISLWGATHPAMGFLGYGQSETDCLQCNLTCRPCSAYGNKPCRYGDYRCWNITPEEVVNYVKKAICE